MTIDCPTCKAIALAHKMDAEDGGYPPIDNHPLTPKPVDDREAGVQVTQGDRDLFRELERFVVQGYGGPLLDGEAIEVIARHRDQAERGLRDGIALIREHLANGYVGKAIHAIDRGEVRKALDTRP